MANNLRSTILKGFAAANRIHQKYNLLRIDSAGSTYLDVFDLIQREGILLCFSPLDKLHGAYIPSDNGREGILINSQHPVHLQRFTAAHELGHHTLGHKPSLDINMLGRAPLPSDKYEGIGSDPEQEKEADSFASAFLMPKWLIFKHLQNIDENINFLKNDINLYQMSLRLGVSYSSFCWGLLVLEIFSFHEAEKFANIKVKDIKKKIVSEEILKLNPWANVWILNEKLPGVEMLGDKNDLFVFELKEIPSTGYIWDYSHFTDYGLRLLSDEIVEQENEIFGSEIKRHIVFTNDYLMINTLPLHEKRPWNDDIASSLALNFSLKGRGKGFYNKV
ncbi:MAG: ImmA/IrrE family metallo-endopeptidase [Methyloglobulus sp.]|nr:ImmA/IrrE family metallo-endopeptidase [Methyloglobulus sp.]